MEFSGFLTMLTKLIFVHFIILRFKDAFCTLFPLSLLCVNVLLVSRSEMVIRNLSNFALTILLQTT